MQHQQSRADIAADIESAQFVLTTPHGTPTIYGHAMRVIDQHLSADSHTFWQQKYDRRMEELCRD